MPSSWEAMSMTRIHQQMGGGQHERWYELSIRCAQECAKGFVLGAGRAICGFAVLVLLAVLATAQSGTQLDGSVVASSGEIVAGANITLTDAATGLQRATTSNTAGLYQFLDVPPGTYRVDATAKGFSPYLASNVILVV